MTITAPPTLEAQPLVIDVMTQAGDWPTRDQLTALCMRAVDATLETARPKLVPGAEVSVVFTDDRHIRAFNRRYRGKDEPTNVLSFPAPPPAGGRDAGPMLGDVVLARETILREARGHGLTPDDHTTHLIIHGLLHLLGHDHVSDDEAADMEGLETAILGRLGIADPYCA